MQKFVACFVCTLALMAVIVSIAIAEDDLTDTANMTLNQTQNATGNITLNETMNTAANIALNDTQNATENTTQKSAENANQQTKVLRAGFEKTKPLNNLSGYGNNSTYKRSTRSAFTLSQRLGNVSKFNYNTDIYTPVYNVSQYSRTKPIYEAPGTLASRQVYSISGYPVAKVLSSIP